MSCITVLCYECNCIVSVSEFENVSHLKCSMCPNIVSLRFEVCLINIWTSTECRNHADVELPIVESPPSSAHNRTAEIDILHRKCVAVEIKFI